MNLENYICELLYHHDCVIVTDLGGFVANYRPAFIHPAHHTITAPSKKIAFNASLTYNDGLLATHIASKLNITYAEACNLIRDFKEDCFDVLNKGGQLTLNKIGVMYLDHEKNIQFNADNGSNYLLESFGLGTVHAPILKKEFEKDTIIKAFETKEKKSWWRLLEVIPAAAAIALLLLNPHSVDRMINNSLNSFNPLDTFKQQTVNNIPAPTANKITPVETPVVNEPLQNEPAAAQPENNNTLSVTETPATESINADASKETSASAISNESATGRFYIVAGCFKIEANAENFKNDLIAKGYHADIIGTYKGLQVVSCAVAPSQSEADAALQNIKQTLEAGAWIMKK